MKTIQIDIDPDGSTRIETTGFAGKACQDATAEIEKALGMVKSDTKKPEFNVRTVGRQNVGH